MPQLLLTLVFIGIGWFLLIRPQQARVREHRSVVATLAEGDRVITAGGIYGTLVAVETETVRLDVAPGVELTVARAAVSRRVGEGDGDEAHRQGNIDTDDTTPGRSGEQAEDNVQHDEDGPIAGGPA